MELYSIAYFYQNYTTIVFALFRSWSEILESRNTIFTPTCTLHPGPVMLWSDPLPCVLVDLQEKLFSRIPQLPGAVIELFRLFCHTKYFFVFQNNSIAIQNNL